MGCGQWMRLCMMAAYYGWLVSLYIENQYKILLTIPDKKTSFAIVCYTTTIAISNYLTMSLTTVKSIWFNLAIRSLFIVKSRPVSPDLNCGPSRRDAKIIRKLDKLFKMIWSPLPAGSLSMPSHNNLILIISEIRICVPW
jgi:hypothetical protein